jgi:RNA polymerase sigma-70 factor (ECF subfamily)
LQDTLRVIIERLRKSSIKEPAKLSQFIHATARNILIGHYRKEMRRATQVNSQIIERAVDQSHDQIQAIIKQQQSRYTRKLLRKLSIPRDREILMRFYVWEQEKLQVCQAMELTVTAFDRVVSRARNRFKIIHQQ